MLRQLRLTLVVPVAVLMLSSAGSAAAQTFSWSNAAGGSFHAAGNWSPAGGPPLAAHNALFNLAGTFTVTFSSPVTNTQSTASAGNVTWALGGQTYNISSFASVNNTTGTLTVNNGSVSSNGLNVGNGSLTSGNLTLSSGANWTSAQGLSVSTGGATGLSTVTVQNGATLTTQSSTNVGSSSSGEGRLTIAGPSTTWTASNFSTNVGFSGGTGRLSILSGATVNSSVGIVVGAIGGTGTLIVRGSGTNVNMSGVGSLTVGSTGTGTGTIEDGAIVNSPNGIVGSGGSSGGGTGVMTVKSLGAQWNVSGFLDVGGSPSSLGDSGILNIQQGGTVNVGTNLRLWNPGTVNLAGGTLSLPTLTFNGGAFQWTAGLLNFTTSQSLTAALASNLFGNPNSLGANRTLSVSSGQLLTVNTPLQVSGQLSGGSVTNNSTLVLSGGSVAATSAFSNNAGRLVIVQGLGSVQGSTSFVNNGTIQLDGPATFLTGAGLSNSGLLFGTGTIHNALANATNGTIRVTGSERLVFTNGTNNNSGNLELVGGTLEFTQTLTNQASGSISGRGALHASTASPGGLGIVNNGVMLFSGGIMDIRGDVHNNSGARIVTAGGGVTTFYDDVVHNGLEIRTNAGARTIFFGSQSGAGAFTGAGTVEYNGDARPGNSPAMVHYEGDVEFSATSRLQIEIMGLIPGARYDQLVVAGNVYLGGRLILDINSFIPEPGDSFTIIDKAGVAPVVGHFQGLPEGSTFFVGDYELQITYQGGTGNDVVLSMAAVPEPGIILLLGAGGLGFGLWRRYRGTAAAIDAAAGMED